MIAESETLSRAESLHARLAETRRERRKLDHQTGALLRIIDDEQLFRPLGYASVREYARKAHGITTRACREYLYAARRFDELDRVGAAYAAGELDKTKVREIVRVASGDSQDAWIAAAKSATNRELELLIAGRTPEGYPPPVVPDPPLRPEVVRVTFEMYAAEADRLKQILALLRMQMGTAGRDVSDGTLLAIIGRFAASHAEMDVVPTGAEPYHVVITTSEAGTSCGEHAVADAIVEEAACDAVITDLRPGPKQGHSVRSVPPAARMIALAAHDFTCAVPGCSHKLLLDIHHIGGRHIPDPHNPRNLVALCPGHHRVHHEGHLGVERLPDGRLRFTDRFGTTHVGARRTPPRSPPESRRLPGLTALLQGAAGRAHDPTSGRRPASDPRGRPAGGAIAAGVAAYVADP